MIAALYSENARTVLWMELHPVYDAGVSATHTTPASTARMRSSGSASTRVPPMRRATRSRQSSTDNMAGIIPAMAFLASSAVGRVLGTLALVAAVVVAFFAGVLVERLRFDAQRTDMLRRYDQALRQHQEQIMQSEKQSAKIR